MDVISVSFQIVNGIDPFPFFSSVVQVAIVVVVVTINIF